MWVWQAAAAGRVFEQVLVGCASPALVLLGLAVTGGTGWEGLGSWYVLLRVDMVIGFRFASATCVPEGSCSSTAGLLLVVWPLAQCWEMRRGCWCCFPEAQHRALLALATVWNRVLTVLTCQKTERSHQELGCIGLTCWIGWQRLDTTALVLLCVQIDVRTCMLFVAWRQGAVCCSHYSCTAWQLMTCPCADPSHVRLPPKQHPCNTTTLHGFC